MSDVSRRTMLKGGFGAGVGIAVVAGGSASSAASSTVALSDFGSLTADDNAEALERAAAAAGDGGTVTVSGGTWKIARTVSLPSVTVVGTGSGTPRFHFTAGAYGLNANPGQSSGLVLRNLTFSRTNGATSSFLHVGTDVTVDTCDFFDPQMYAIDVYRGTLTVTKCRFIAAPRGVGTGIHVGNDDAHLDVSDTTFAGLQQGHVAIGAGHVKASHNTYLGMWFYQSRAVCSAVVASATSTSVKATKTLPKKDFAPQATAVAWEKVASSVSLVGVAGRPGWYSVNGVTLEERMMMRGPNTFAMVLQTEGSLAYMPHWFMASGYLVKANVPRMAGVTVERPYIGRVTSIDDDVVNVASWHAGAKGEYENPPAGSRLQINDKTGYQCFATNGTKSFTVDSCTFVAAWADQVSCINGQDVTITNNRLYDGQDVSITVEGVTNGCVVANNTAYRSGTAAVYIGAGSAQVSGNTSYGANMMTDKSPDYSAFTFQGANWANFWSNTAVYGGAPFEKAAISIDGVDGQDNASDESRRQGPFATNLHIRGNTYRGYPEHDVVMWGTNAFCQPGATSWADGTRFDLQQGATEDMLAKG